MLRLVLVQLINDVAFSNLLPKKRDDHLTFSFDLVCHKEMTESLDIMAPLFFLVIIFAHFN